MRFTGGINERGVRKREGYEKMLPLHRAKIGDNLYRQVVAFLYEKPFPYNVDRGPHTFEVVVPAAIPIFGKHMSVFSVSPGLYH